MRMGYVDRIVEKDAREIGESVKKYVESAMALNAYYKANVNKNEFPEFEDWFHEVAEVVL